MDRPHDLCFFVSDLHGKSERYDILFQKVKEEAPRFVFMTGDLLPSWASMRGDFLSDYFIVELSLLRQQMGESYPVWMIILGNDDPKVEEVKLQQAEVEGLLYYMHNRHLTLDGYDFYGYAYIPPTPFLLKDWERYDVGVYVDPGCVHPSEGFRSVELNEDIRFTNIAAELNQLASSQPMDKAVWLFHSPPYNSSLDRAALDGKMIDYVPLDVHVGSIAIQRFIADRQPMVTMHGHIHESSRLTGKWSQVFGSTVAFNAAIDQPGLSLIRFNLSAPVEAGRHIYPYEE
jgi:uncharacterized protein